MAATYPGGIKTWTPLVDGVDQAEVTQVNTIYEEVTALETACIQATTAVKGLVEIAIASELNTGTDATRAVSPDSLAGSNYGIRIVEIALNGTTALTTSDKAYFRIPAIMNGWNLISVAAMCKTNTTGPTITVKNGATSMLSTNITIDNGEFDTLTAATPAVIDAAQDNVATAAQIEIAVSGAGTGITFCSVELGFQLP